MRHLKKVTKGSCERVLFPRPTVITRWCYCPENIQVNPRPFTRYIVPLDRKGCICHLTMWQIHPFISTGTICWYNVGPASQESAILAVVNFCDALTTRRCRIHREGANNINQFRSWVSITWSTTFLMCNLYLHISAEPTSAVDAIYWSTTKFYTVLKSRAKHDYNGDPIKSLLLRMKWVFKHKISKSKRQQIWVIFLLNPLTAGVAYIRVFTFH